MDLSKKSDSEIFASQLQHLGGLILSRNGRLRDYVDLEMFALDATTHIFNDSRLTRCTELWFSRYGKLLSIPRLQSLIDSGYPFHSPGLGALLSISDVSFPDRGYFKRLAKYCKKDSNVPLFPYFRDLKRADPRWLRYGIIAPHFNIDEESHFLIDPSKEKKIPEIHLRQKGLPPMAANIMSKLMINKKISLYRIALDLDVTYAYTHRVCRKYANLV